VIRGIVSEALEFAVGQADEFLAIDLRSLGVQSRSVMESAMLILHSGRELILLLAIGSALTIAVCSLALWLLPFKVVRDVSLSFRLG
jgi:hypothetical protein